VVVVTGLFALLAIGIAAYGNVAEDVSAVVTGPSLVTLATLFVPLVALVLGHDAIVGEKERHTLGLLFSLPVRRSVVLLSKYLGRFLALSLAVTIGLGAASLVLGTGQRTVVVGLIPPTLLLGASFLSIGVWISSFTDRVATAASVGLALWFLLVFFYDLALLMVLVATDGAINQETIAWAVSLNPAGLYRVSLMSQLLGEATMAELGLTVSLPGFFQSAAIWLTWIVAPLLLGSFHIGRRGGLNR
jgi:Cu-processing system permease protein